MECQSDTKDYSAVDPPAQPRVGPLDYLRSLPFVLAFVGILVGFDILQRMALFFGGRCRFQQVTIAMNRCLVRSFGITGATFSVEFEEELVAPGPLILVSNHQSLMDIPILYTIFGDRNPRFISKKELGRWLPFVSFNLRNNGHVLIDRTKGKHAVEAISKLGSEMAEAGFAISIFPEGTRARDGVLKGFKSAGLDALLRACPDAHVLPVAIDGLWKFARYKLMPVPGNLHLRVRVGRAARPQPGETAAQVMERQHRWISDALNKMRE